MAFAKGSAGIMDHGDMHGMPQHSQTCHLCLHGMLSHSQTSTAIRDCMGCYRTTTTRDLHGMMLSFFRQAAETSILDIGPTEGRVG